MADIDINPFGDHESRPEEPMGENIPLTPEGGSTWEPEREQETSFRGGESQRTRLVKEDVERLYKKLSKIYELPKERYSNLFKIENIELYYIGLNTPLTYDNGKLRSVKELVKYLGKTRLHSLGLFVEKDEVTAEQAVKLNRVKEEMSSASDVAKADDIEIQEIAKSTEDLITQGQEMLPMRELLELDKQLRSIRGSLMVEVAKKVQLAESIRRKFEEFRDHPGAYDDGIREDTMKRIAKLNDELKARQESIDLLKGRLTNQITSFKETIVKVLNKDTSLAEKIRTLFREQGITIASILMAVGMAKCFGCFG